MNLNELQSLNIRELNELAQKMSIEGGVAGLNKQELIVKILETHAKKDNSFSGFPGCWNMVILVFFALTPNFWIILGIVIALTVSMFLPVEFIHPVRTKRWRALNLPVAFLWTLCAGLAALADFDPGPQVLIGLSISSLYLLFAGILMQIFPKNSEQDA